MSILRREPNAPGDILSYKYESRNTPCDTATIFRRKDAKSTQGPIVPSQYVEELLPIALLVSGINDERIPDRSDHPILRPSIQDLGRQIDERMRLQSTKTQDSPSSSLNEDNRQIRRHPEILSFLNSSDSEPHQTTIGKMKAMAIKQISTNPRHQQSRNDLHTSKSWTNGPDSMRNQDVRQSYHETWPAGRFNAQLTKEPFTTCTIQETGPKGAVDVDGGRMAPPIPCLRDPMVKPLPYKPPGRVPDAVGIGRPKPQQTDNDGLCQKVQGEYPDAFNIRAIQHDITVSVLRQINIIVQLEKCGLLK